MDPKIKMALIEELLQHLTSKDDEDLKGSLPPKVSAVEVSAKPEDGASPMDGLDSKDDSGMDANDIQELLAHYSGIKS